MTTLPVLTDERHGLGFDEEVGIAARVGIADLGVAMVDEQPVVPVAGRLVREDEGDDDPIRRELRAVELCLTPGPQGEAGVGVRVGHLDPSLAPLAERMDHRRQIGAGVGQPGYHLMAALLRLGADHAGVFELGEPLGQHRPGHGRDTPGQVVERVRPEHQVADQQRCPPLGHDLRCSGDRAVLTGILTSSRSRSARSTSGVRNQKWRGPAGDRTLVP